MGTPISKRTATDDGEAIAVPDPAALDPVQALAWLAPRAGAARTPRQAAEALVRRGVLTLDEAHAFANKAGLALFAGLVARIAAGASGRLPSPDPPPPRRPEA